MKKPAASEERTNVADSKVVIDKEITGNRQWVTGKVVDNKETGRNKVAVINKTVVVKINKDPTNRSSKGPLNPEEDQRKEVAASKTGRSKGHHKTVDRKTNKGLILISKGPIQTIIIAEKINNYKVTPV